MDKGHWLRRCFHLCAPLFLVYYLMPEDFLGLGRDNLILLVFAVIMVFEAVRLATGRIFVGLREYERKQLSAYAWAAIGIVIAFFFFPMIFVIPAVTGIGWTDPLIGEMKRRKWKGYPYIPLAVYAAIVVGSLLVFSDLEMWKIALLAVVGASVAITVEKPTLKQVDDDFLMMICPLVAMYLTNELFSYLA